MALQICPKCKELSFTWYIDEEQSPLTQWNCKCGYLAFEDETKIRDCPVCKNKKSDSYMIDTTGKYWWCYRCGKFELIEYDDKIINARKNWWKASSILNFKFISPYNFKYTKIDYNLFGYLPELGSKNGILIDIIFPPKFYTDKTIIKISKQINCSYSFINYKAIETYDEKYFMDMLKDWKIK
jgi:hypothetical protein